MKIVKNSLINKILNEFESEHDYYVIGCSDNGSKAWGYASESSDDDLKAVFIRKDYTKYTTIFQYNDSYRNKFDEEDIDITYYDITKLLKFISSGNAQGYEFLFTPKVLKTSSHMQLLKMFAFDKFSKNKKKLGYHYYGLAKSTYSRRVENKKDISKYHQWLYIIRPILSVMYMQQHDGLPSLDFNQLLTEVKILDVRAFQLILTIVENKKMGKTDEFLSETDSLHLSNWVEESINSIKLFLDNMPKISDNDEGEKEDYDKMLYMLVNSKHEILEKQYKDYINKT